VVCVEVVLEVVVLLLVDVLDDVLDVRLCRVLPVDVVLRVLLVVTVLVVGRRTAGGEAASSGSPRRRRTAACISSPLELQVRPAASAQLALLLAAVSHKKTALNRSTAKEASMLNAGISAPAA